VLELHGNPLSDHGSISKGESGMKKLKLTPEHLRVDSFPVQDLPADPTGTVQAYVTMLPFTCPECAPTRGQPTCP
jgi:hypothetical protein